MAKRGRKKRPSQSTLPPRGFYRAAVAPLFARRPDGLQISDKAFRLWHVIQAYNWDGSGCDLTDEELAPLIGVRRRPTVVRLRAELRAAGLLREHFPSGGRRLLEPTGMGLFWSGEAPSHPGPVAEGTEISVRPGVHQPCTPRRTQIQQEEEDIYTDRENGNME